MVIKKTGTYFLYLLVLVVFFSQNLVAQKMTISSYNIRYDNPRDTGNLWQDRKHAVVALVQYHDFDVFGVQEALKHQLQDLSGALKGYAVYGRGRDDGQSKGEHSSIYYKKAQFDLVASGDFWLSATPEKPGPGWDANLNRICSWVQLKEKKSGKTFHVFNAHYDHQGVQARIESSKLVLLKIKEIAGGGPVIFMGDLNGNRESEWYRSLSGSALLRDSHNLARQPYQPNGSFNGFKTGGVSKEVIDHVFVSSHFDVKKWAVLTDTYQGKFPSDHFPVAVDLSIR
jgi:endonuclease/exonuclease/phosphatase family metal-dependent hydrolase